MRKRLLIIEDNPLVIHAYQLLLKDYPNIQPLFTERGDETLTLLDTLAHPLDLIFLDYGLPDMDGFVLAQRLRRQKGVRCPIIVISTNAISPLMQGHHHPLIQRFYQKPLRSDQFQQIIERYL